MKSLNLLKAVIMVLALGGLAACNKSASSFSLLPETNNFNQAPKIVEGKIDILFVIDNSGSMQSVQDALANNFQNFINRFSQKQYDYRIAVATSDAFLTVFNGNQAYSRFKDGTNQTSHTGVFIIDPTTPNIEQTFMTNIRQGVLGSGDERAFQSFKAALQNPTNAASFPRPGAFLSVIIVSDEDDFSHDGSTSKGGQYSYSGIHTIDSYVTFLSTLTGSTPEKRNFSVSSMAILDSACLAQLNAVSPGKKIGYRYMELSDATEGAKGSLCGDFSVELDKISNKIVELTMKFYLDEEPQPNSITVRINGIDVPNEPVNGFTYHAEGNYVSFNANGTFSPKAGDSIEVRFDPIAIR